MRWETTPESSGFAVEGDQQFMLKNYYDKNYIESNRDKKRKPKCGFGYCLFCDKSLVSNGQKCNVCGHRNGIKKFK